MPSSANHRAPVTRSEWPPKRGRSRSSRRGRCKRDATRSMQRTISTLSTTSPLAVGKSGKA
eukprot:6509363-Lingulodinium_polyedra.AAC.1